MVKRLSKTKKGWEKKEFNTYKFMPERRKHGCDVCHIDKPTELFLGYRFNCLWVCGDCQQKITNGIVKRHKKNIFDAGEYKKEYL